MPAVIGDDELFVVTVENMATRQHSGSFSFSGEMWKGLSSWSLNQAEGNNTCFAFDQGDNTDDEYFIGHDGNDSVLLSTDAAGAGDDKRIVIWKVGGGEKGDKGDTGEKGDPGSGGGGGGAETIFTGAATYRAADL